MKAYKYTILIIDHEDIGKEDISSCLKNAKYINPEIMHIQEADIGDWSDSHPLNHNETQKDEFNRLFNN
jgi:hypothetical protein